ncbi:MAG: hypothetical protein LBC31_08545 [Treponema sp.]|nr:hypothetical protein [Treponema sp.]
MNGTKAIKKMAAEYPSGWNLNRTTTAAEGDVPWELDSKGRHRFFLNADKNRLTQGVGDPTDIWVKQ